MENKEKDEEKSTFGDRMSKDVEYKIVKKGEKQPKSENEKEEKS